MKIGIIGLGYVGGAIRAAMQLNAPEVELVCIDPYKGETGTYEDLKDAEGVFICVPTPQNSDGSCDVGPFSEVLYFLGKTKYSGVIIGKSTAPPNVYRAFNIQMQNLVHVPEFLTAANPVNDYMNGTFAIIGASSNNYSLMAEKIIRLSQIKLESVHFCAIDEAALTKYAINSFLATKVIFMNELKTLADKMGMDYNQIATILAVDPRIGSTHLKVPGPDGSFGFGGACFPKDTSALLCVAKHYDIDLSVLSSAVEKNKKLR